MSAQKAPDFTITDFDNKTHTLYEDYLDKGKVVMIKIMFASCPPCNSSAPRIQDLYEEFGEGTEDVQFFALSNKSWDSNSGIEAFADKHSLTFPGAGKDGGALTAVAPYTSGMFGSFFGTPTYVVIDPKGNVNFKVPRQDLKDAIEDALDDQGGGCANSFGGIVEGRDGNPKAYLRSEIAGSQVYELEVDPSDGQFEYKCEFTFPPQAFEYSLSVEADGNDIEGVSVKDILILIRHLLGIKALESTEMKIAADFTANGFLSVRDVSEIRKLILGRFSDNPHHDSWIFWHETSDFSQDSSGILIPDLITNIPLMDAVDSVLSGNFEGVKLGDISGDINPFFTNTKTRSPQVTQLTYTDQWVEAGKEYDIVLHGFQANLGGFQMALQGNFEISQVEFSDPALTIASSQNNEEARILGYHPQGAMISGNNSLMLNITPAQSGWISDMMKLSDSFHAEIATDDNEQVIELSAENLSNEIYASPNPNDGEFFIHSNLDIERLDIYNINGQPVSYQGLSQNSSRMKVRIPNHNHGMYIVSLSLENGDRRILRVKVR